MKHKLTHRQYEHILVGLIKLKRHKDFKKEEKEIKKLITLIFFNDKIEITINNNFDYDTLISSEH